MKFKILSVIFLSFFLTTHNVWATENPFTISVVKGTNKATINTISSKGNINGTTSISKSTGLPIKTCNSSFNSEGKSTPCEVTGLSSSTTYYITVSASDGSGNSYQGKQSFVLATPTVPPSPPVIPKSDFKVTIAVQGTEKEVKITTTNKTDDPLYKITTTLSNSIGFNTIKSGNFDTINGQIVQTFSDLTVKSDYFVTIKGERVSPTSKVETITKTYSFVTNAVKPGIVETGNTTTPTGLDPNPVPPDPQNTPYVPTPPVTVTTPGTVLTPEQIAADKLGNGLIPCKDTCDFNDVLQLINNLVTFLIKELFIPIIIILFMYAGYQYITAEGNPAKVANLKKMVWHIVLGMLLVLCSWLIVKTLISILSKDGDSVLQFLK